MSVSAARVRRLKKSINKLNVSKEVKGILVKIALEVEGGWADTVKQLRREVRDLKKRLNR